MRLLLAVPITLALLLVSVVMHATDAVKQCEDFLGKFQKCVDGLKGEQQEEARVFLKTLRGTLGMADGVNRGDPQMTGMLCSVMRDEAKKDPEIQKYGCTW